jgi:SpoIID/LytB domain protein
MNNRRRWLAVAALACASIAVQLPPTPAAAETEFIFRGGGWGHGLGMGQYGAKGAADAGRAFNQILNHFYPNTAVTRKGLPSSIRVGLEQDVSSVALNGNGKFEFRIDGNPVVTANSGGAWTVRPTSSGAYELSGPGGRTVGSAGKLLEVRFREFNTILTVSGRRYTHEWLEIRSYRTSSYVLRAVLHIKPIERYVYGIGEVPSSWPMEALKAQAVAARTYAVEKMLRLGVRSGCGCHILDDTRDQVYVGYEKEAGPSGSRWRSAVDATAGQVVVYNDRPIQALYHSSSGGHTEHNENVFRGTPLPYLRGVSDPWDGASPNHSWTVRFDRQALGRKLATSSTTSVGDLHSLVLPAPKGVSGRVTPTRDGGRGGVTITGSSGTKRVDGERLRSVLGLRSTKFTVSSEGLVHPDGTLLQGSGNIHVLRNGTLVRVGSQVLGSAWRSSEIVRVSDATLRRYSVGTAGFRAGTLLRTPDGKVWIVSDGVRRHIVSGAVFDGLGYDRGVIRNVSAGEGALHPVGSSVRSASVHPNGTLLKGSSAAVYFLDNGKRRHVQSAHILASQFRRDEIVTVPDSTLSRYPTGAKLGFRDGTLIRTPDDKVWAISDGMRRHIVSGQVLSGLGYNRDVIRDVSADDAALHEVGPRIV